MFSRYIIFLLFVGVAFSFPQESAEPEPEPEHEPEPEPYSSEDHEHHDKHKMMIMGAMNVHHGENCDYDEKTKEAYKICASAMAENLMENMKEMKDEIEENAMNCVTDLEMKDKFEMFYCHKMKYSPMPAHTFIMAMSMMGHRRRRHHEKLNELTCCAMKPLGIVKDDNSIDVDALTQKMKDGTDNQDVIDAMDKASSECEAPKGCNKMKMMECYMDVCAKHVASTM